MSSANGLTPFIRYPEEGEAKEEMENEDWPHKTYLSVIVNINFSSKSNILKEYLFWRE